MIEILPEVGAIVGYTAGQLAEQKARHDIARNGQALLGAHEEVTVDGADKQSLFRRATASLALMGAITGFAAAEAAKPATAKIQENPTLVTVIDHSFGTGQNGHVERINDIAGVVINNRTLRVRPMLAHNSSQESVKDEQAIDNDTPYGSPSVRSATSAALDTAYNNSLHGEAPKQLGSEVKRNSGVLVVTDGNSLGSAHSVIEAADEHDNMPIFIANVGQASKAEIKAMQAIAEQTGGQYWQAKHNAQAIASKINKTISPRAIHPERSLSDRLPYALIALTALGTAAGFFRRYRRTLLPNQDASPSSL